MTMIISLLAKNQRPDRSSPLLFDDQQQLFLISPGFSPELVETLRNLKSVPRFKPWHA